MSPNRLAREKSPYLQQHQDNPVDWYAWGDEAFAKARREDKPIFLSIGYSTCHWCHVMAHESFEDASIGAMLNRDFVSIKVDREERPDVDRVYMTFVQATTGAGGWPMSVWLTPDLQPFFGGTYFPPSSRWGRPGFSEILAQLARAWTQDRTRLIDSAASMLEHLRQATGSADGDERGRERAPVADTSAIDEGIASFRQAFDPRHGGFGGAPKFPRPSELMFLMHAYALTNDHYARQMTLETLRAMALGGMRDHVGGGFHRYSVDAEWRVPHFEKMLYDQAQLVLAYLDAAQMSGEAFYAAVAEDTLAYVVRDLTSPEGGFYSAEDADSEDPSPTPHAPSPTPHTKREGAFYVWRASEIDTLFGDDAQIVRRRFGIEDAGNALADPQQEFVGQNLLYVAQSVEDIATRSSRSVEDVMQVLANARQTLFDVRAKRPRPHLDDKIITAWNGLMIAAFARAARTLADSPNRTVWRDAAVRAATFVRTQLWDAKTRRLLRRFRAGESGIDAFCEDYAYLVFGLIELFQATGDGPWLEWALEITRAQVELFFDERDGGWFATTGEDPSVLLRLKEDYDGAEPAAASVTVRNLLTIGHLVADTALIDTARRTLERYGPQLGQVARVMPLMLSNVALWHAGAPQVVIAGSPGASDTHALEQAVSRAYVPGLIQIPLPPEGAGDALGSRLPWLAAMSARDGRATAYVCRDFTCREPVADVAPLERQLGDITGPCRIR